MVEVFRTNVDNTLLANEIVVEMRKIIPDSRISFDLEDCDRILRIEGNEIAIEKITLFVTNMGHFCEVLE